MATSPCTERVKPTMYIIIKTCWGLLLVDRSHVGWRDKDLCISVYHRECMRADRQSTRHCIVVLPLLYKMSLPIHIPTNMICLPTVGLLLEQHHKRWTNIKPTLGQCLVFARISHMRRYNTVSSVSCRKTFWVLNV